MSEPLTIQAVDGLPEIAPGADLAALIVDAAGGQLGAGVVVCVAHKLVSKAEGRIVDLDGVQPTEATVRLAAASGRDPRHLQVILDESSEIIRAERDVLICRTHHGFVCANAGVDLSNAGPAGGAADPTDDGTSDPDRGRRSARPGDRAVLLPLDPDGSAQRLRAALQSSTGVAPIAVVIADSFGRAWRVGQVDVAIGVAGVVEPVVAPPPGATDRDGLALKATMPALADEIAAAAGLARTKAGGQGVVIVRGLGHAVGQADGPGALALVRPRDEDLFGARRGEGG